ncbi:glycoside hydrolase family 108 protein [Pasteurella multocida]|uniref:glycoside hydrolase family 108 protein n=1 Tax=Pasteurella multocida TaxID=747 RepID=UPI00147AD85D|nr:glycoside hydrolase family 108 protein [Pasteurella multocida]NNI07714.1 hypothetical protein [Pasteurella multocida]NNI33456.1 hypothetical protein [Pasteurella multocida]
MSQTATLSDFNKAFDRVIQYEGGYVNDPRDAGGETKFGITIHTARANGYTGSMFTMTRDDAKQIYLKAFWQRYRCNEFPPELAFQFFDACVNHGSGNASRMLQRAVGVVDDGIIGEVTLAAIRKRSTVEVVTLFNAERLEFYTKLSGFQHFGKGWIRRMAGNLRYIADDVGDE